jgi:DNA replication protein DnaC
MIDKLARIQLLFLDSWGTHSLTDQQRLDLTELFEERCQRGSTIITARTPVLDWHQMIGEPISADAIPDRIIPNARRIELKKDSMAQESTKPELTQTEDPEIIPPDE